MSQGRFADKVAVVTGGAAGIGRATAERLIADGATVVLVDADLAQLEKTGAEIGASTLITADVSDEQAVRSYVAQSVAAHGRIDLFHNNAGIEGKFGVSIMDTDISDFDRLMAVNVRGVFLGLREVMRSMIETGGGGAIVVTASMGGLRGASGFSPYVTSKHAVVGLTRCAAHEGAPFGIRVNAVAPGHIDTRMARSLNEQARPEDPMGLYDERAETIPMKRYGTATEVANVVTFLLSDDAVYVTGAVSSIDAGLTA
jgi:3alpha(or 20beta)-hydroxysteroid dehydrogenase